MNHSKFKGIVCTPRPNEHDDKFIKRFLRKVRNEGILQEVYFKSSYEKPSLKRRRKSSRARFLRKLEEGNE